MNQTDHQILQARSDKIRGFLSWTTEPFDDWEYDGDELLIIYKNKVIEKYLNHDLEEIIRDFS